MPARSANLIGKPKPVDEKITINIGCVDLGQIDLLVQEGFYNNRTDLIRTAIRNQIAAHQDVVRQVVSRKTLALGIQHYSAADLKAVKAAGRDAGHQGAGPGLDRRRRHAGAGAGHHSNHSPCWARFMPALPSRPRCASRTANT